jgi:hypothetical protein
MLKHPEGCCSHQAGRLHNPQAYAKITITVKDWGKVQVVECLLKQARGHELKPQYHWKKKKKTSIEVQKYLPFNKVKFIMSSR